VHPLINRDSKTRVAKRFGDYLRSLRRQKGWTQSRAGEAVGVDTVTIRRWELGLFSPSSNRFAQVAAAYGVEASEMVDASKDAEQDESTAFLPIRGYLAAGSNSESDTSDLGNIALPSYMAPGSSKDYCLRVNGDSLVPDGIHDGDVLLVCPDQAPSIGSLCVIDVDIRLRAVTYITQESFRVRTTTGATVDVAITPEQMVGTVALHVRKM
jgi:SOS-response transcriptional repressor LexA